jgi:D-alanyl-D-alanine carboxypeptidase
MSQSITGPHYRRRRPRIARIVSAELRTYVEELMAVHSTPGLQLAVTDRDGIVASECFGHADFAAGALVTRETFFEHGSIGKTFTSVLLLQLREDGLLALDAPVTEYLPWFEVRSEHEPITIHHLLTHSSGLMMGADMSADSRFDVWALRETETGFAPGTRFSYSNVGFRTLGFVVEELTGMSYGEVVRQRILEPLGLESTLAKIANEGRHRLAVGYQRLHDDRPARRDDPWAPAPWVETGTADGSLAGTMEDLAAFLRALLNRDDGLLKPESYDLLVTPHLESDEESFAAYGLFLVDRDGRREILHGGSMPGYQALMAGDPEAGLGVALAANTGEESPVLEAVAAAALDFFREGKALPAVPDPLAVENAADYEGVYGNLELAAADGRLLVDGEPLEPRGDDRFLARDPRLSLFLLEAVREDDQVVALAHGGDVYRREGESTASSPSEWSAYPGHYRAYNPWYSNFRIVLREGVLTIVFPGSQGWPLLPQDDGSFRVADEWSPERLGFDAVVDGTALRVDYAGESYYRMP